MTSVIAPLCERCLDLCDPEAAGCIAMGALGCGQRGVVAGFRAEEDMTVCRRLFDLGFAQGVEVELVRRAPMRDPLVFRIAGGEMLLRRRDADRIVVRVA
ncbi:MAG: FeoA family protein [Brooklawnia sp.]|uniref:FeoA family protein n=1 Tax=Brooklawnia sp. TaxID=2699740 RepID=UPI003C7668D0